MSRTLGPWNRRVEIGLLVATVLVASGLAVLDARSSLARALRTRAPFPLALSGEQSSPALVYQPARRVLYAIQGPAQPLPVPPVELDAALPFRSPAELKDWFRSRPTGARFAVEAARRIGRSARGVGSAYDLALAAWELYRLPDSRLRPVSRPPAALRARLDELLWGEPPPADPAPLRVEVLNASGEPGVALQATKALRARGLDVIDFGNAAAAEERTRAIDRAGRPEDAALAARALGCPDPDVSVELDVNASAAATVVLGRDFRQCGAFSSGILRAILRPTSR